MIDSSGRIRILLDVGGTEIKGMAAGDNGQETPARSFPADSGKECDTILSGFLAIIRKLAGDAGVCSAQEIGSVGMAFPGPFDYERGISRMRGLGKYDALYGVALERALKDRCPELSGAVFAFVNDVTAFGIGEAAEGKAAGCRRIFGVCLGTGAGSVFLKDGRPVGGEEPGVPENGWIYGTPFPEDGRILDDVLSARGLAALSEKVLGAGLTGRELAERAKRGETGALRVWQYFGENLVKGLTPFLDSFRPDALVLGGQISKSFVYFHEPLAAACRERAVHLYPEEDSSRLTMRGLYYFMRERLRTEHDENISQL